MYHTGPSGFIKSYNFDGGDQLTGAKFSTCIRREHGYCTIGYMFNQGSTIDAFITDTTNAIAVNVRVTIA